MIIFGRLEKFFPWFQAGLHDLYSRRSLCVVFVFKSGNFFFNYLLVSI